jgi:hypothetical protein
MEPIAVIEDPSEIARYLESIGEHARAPPGGLASRRAA